MRRKKLLMLGGSAQQVPAIEKAKELGLQTILIDYLPDNPGQWVADKWYRESTTDIDAVYKIAKEEKVDGILAYASDPAALPAAIVAEKLGLPTNPAQSVEILGVKHKFRKFLKENNINCPEFIEFNVSEDCNSVKQRLKEFQFPLLIKPTDSSGSKGVSVINDIKDFEKAVAYASVFSHNKILIAEEYIEKGYPFLIGGDILVEEGKIVLKGDMACMRDNKCKDLVPVGKIKPSGLSPIQREKIYATLQNIINLLEIRNGEFNIEIILDKESNLFVLEIGPRAGGNMIPIQLSDAFRVDLIKANINFALGESSGIRPNEVPSFFLTHVLHSNEDGIYKGVEIADELKPYIYRQEIYKISGEKVEKFDGAGKAIGILFFKFPDKEVMQNLVDKINSMIKIILK